jgi:hypothetical protein
VFPQIRNSYICYHATQHPEFDKNGGQTMYLTYGNIATYTLWLDRLILAAPFAQWDDAAGRSLYVRQGRAVPDAAERGVAFYAPTEPGEGLTAIHDWYDPATAEHRYEATAPAATYVDGGIAFYAATSPQRGLDPVTRWDAAQGTRAVYSSFDLSKKGYTRGPIAFYGATLPDQTPFNPDKGYVYWVRETGGHDFGCCDQTNNPTRQTQDRTYEFTLGVDPSPRGYEAIVCSPVCGTSGKLVWSGPVTFSPNVKGGKLTLTPGGPK